MASLEEVSREWLALPGRRERTFSLGRFDRKYLADCPLFVVQDAAGRVTAFANEIPSYRSGEATIDLMRHRQEIVNGTMDYLFMEMFTALAAAGFRTFDLGLAPFAGIGELPGASLQERALHEIFAHLNRFFSYKGLREYKSKFGPRWEDRFLAYRGAAPGLLRTGLAIARATEG
jgi:phosphatidylglycerol lysyltransferase